MLSFLLNCKRIYNDFIKDEVTVYAAQASFFIVLSAAPFIMILLTLIQLIPAVSPEDLMHVMTQLLPSSIHPLIESVIQDIQTVSPAALLSVTTVATIWSAARGMLGIERGLNRIIGCRKRRNYLLGRIINSGYTIVFLLMCIFSLVLMVFGSSLQRLLFRYFPMLDRFVSCLISLRTFLALALLTLFFVALAGPDRQAGRAGRPAGLYGCPVQGIHPAGSPALGGTESACAGADRPPDAGPAWPCPGGPGGTGEHVLCRHPVSKRRPSRRAVRRCAPHAGGE